MRLPCGCTNPAVFPDPKTAENRQNDFPAQIAPPLELTVHGGCDTNRLAAGKIPPKNSLHGITDLDETSSHSAYRYPFPLAALAGQEEMQLALMLLLTDPALGGVLLVGQKGTAKSTAVRALPELLPTIRSVDGCPYQCNPADTATMCPECGRKVDEGETLIGTTRPTPVFNPASGRHGRPGCGRARYRTIH